MSTLHYLLFSEASCSTGDQSWRFVLQNIESGQRMVVSDGEPATCGERLELLAVVRGLEALDGPARVTLVTRSRYVSRGIRFGIMEWRANDWQWERFGRVVPVKDRDLWQRVDRALLFHRVECQAWQFEEATTDEPLSCRESNAGVAQVEAPGLVGAASRCSETGPDHFQTDLACQPELAKESRRRLASACLKGAKRRLGQRPRQGTQVRGSKRLDSPEVRPYLLGRLSAALVGKAATLKESFRTVLGPARHLIPGTA